MQQTEQIPKDLPQVGANSTTTRNHTSTVIPKEQTNERTNEQKRERMKEWMRL